MDIGEISRLTGYIFEVPGRIQGPQRLDVEESLGG